MTTFSNNWGRGYLVSCSSFLDILLLPTPVWRKIVKRKSQIRISFHCCYMAAGLMTILSNSVVKEEAILYLARNCSSFLGIPNASGLRRHHWELDVNFDISELPDPGENEWCSGNETSVFGVEFELVGETHFSVRLLSPSLSFLAPAFGWSWVAGNRMR